MTVTGSIKQPGSRRGRSSIAGDKYSANIRQITKIFGGLPVNYHDICPRPRGGRDQFFEDEAIQGEFSARNWKRYGIRGKFLARNGKQYEI